MNKINKMLYNLAESAIQIGEIRALSYGTVPAKWALCDGSLVSRSLYSLLFNIYGTTWGGGDGETTFALPNLNGRTIIGAGESSATGHTLHNLGDIGGEEKHVISSGEMPSHDHIAGHGYNNITSGGKDIVPNVYVNNGRCTNYSNWTGSNTAHNTMQPYSTCQYIIYTGVL